MSSAQRNALFAELKTELERSLNQQNLLELSYLSLLHVAHKTHRS